MNDLLHWAACQTKRGVIVGCDAGSEWLLKWWWRHYTAHNSFPVVFFDFGMTQSARLFCEKKGEVFPLSLPKSFFHSAELFPLPSCWPSHWKKTVQRRRKLWFTKAFALLKTPFEETVWLDLDCQCRGLIQGLFSHCHKNKGFAVALDEPHTVECWKRFGLLLPHVVGYQAGVVAFRHGAPAISKWACHCLTYRNSEYSEQTALSHTIAKHRWKVSLLPSIYNWLTPEQENEEALIAHYGGDERKFHLIRDSTF